ncbi:hypothetical protein [Streptomyces huiliensis]|uniref:hypothetical protein n=1 Tax=Streptomyces huiliensis TaxID=2876027 RepID=UPI001CBEDBCC|nr:hypothetical protein [Streptomyces huiliensis]MBZ4320692.1 hypothetical protein [Streptomyces huiliensis]
MATDDEARDRDCPRAGPRHAAPRKPLLARLHMPAGKAVALAAMPTAVLMGMGFTPQLATAKPGAPSPFGDAFCVTKPDGTPTPDTPTPGTPTADSPTATPSPDEDAAKEKGKSKEKDKDKGKGKDDDKGGATNEPDTGGKPTPDEGKDDTPAETGKPAPKPTADPTPDPPAVPDKGKLPVPPIPPLPPLPDLPRLPDPEATKSPTPTTTPSPDRTGTTDTPAPSATPRPGKSPDRAGKKAEETRRKKETGPTGAPPTAPSATTKPSTEPDDDKTPTPGSTPSGPSGTPSPGATDTKTPPPCPLPNRQSDKGQAAFADNPWFLEANRLTLTGLTYEGVKEVVTAGGQKKSVLKFSADKLAIDDLHALVNDRKRIYHQSGPGKTSTVDGGRVTMYTEQLKGKLLGSTLPLFAADYTAEHPPPLIPGLKLPIPIFFTDVKIRQAGQFGGNLTIPNMRVYVTDGVYP